MSKHRFKKKDFFVEPDKKINLSKIDTDSPKKFAEDGKDKKTAKKLIADDLKNLKVQQEKLFANRQQSLIIVLQGMDAAGKDSCIEHVFGGINPQGCNVQGFGPPSSEELQHHYLWRPMQFLPKRGMMAIFNRSYYEEVMVVRVHPEFLDAQVLPKLKSRAGIWKHRFEEIKSFEEMLYQHGTRIVKIFLHVSQEVQLERLVDRLEEPDKHWKVNLNDFEERKLWSKYEHAIEQMLSGTSTDDSPWYVVPSDSKWYARSVVADLINQHLDDMKVEFPDTPSDVSKRYLELAQQYRGDSPEQEDEQEECEESKE